MVEVEAAIGLSPEGVVGGSPIVYRDGRCTVARLFLSRIFWPRVIYRFSGAGMGSVPGARAKQRLATTELCSLVFSAGAGLGGRHCVASCLTTA